ncbi:DUF2225 domain-containing protein [Ferdinandcohnia quinoae]|uniref:DUF2225 domain-containing protein n=1 Tax=Fredinandcohnia quinoae TaxID=2918902 RepID=A0AAW5E1T7_9BACI|nr:DUF2225 domain-containing protein [Fredinandcohnia sp. SECRCQ15]MCH1625529.1 DUF2225 domain-containing protein [Fredinandcohnia sp. SECRCQ15]
MELEPLYDKSKTCSICNKGYKTKRLRSGFVKAIKHDSDFCSYYENEALNPLLYYVSVCPHCGFSVSEEFTTSFPPNTIEAIKNNICAKWSGSNYCEERSIQKAISTYKLAIYSATLKEEKHITIAGLYMRLSWIYRTIHNDEQENRFMSLALEEYIQSYLNSDFLNTQMSVTRLFYLIGEVSWRTGNTDQATKYFSKVIEKQKDNTQEKNIVEMAKERWQEIREEKNKIG